MRLFIIALALFIIGGLWYGLRLLYGLRLSQSEEGFESLENCLDQGYPPNFCKRVPIQSCISCFA
jgi:hypothetical protein